MDCMHLQSALSVLFMPHVPLKQESIAALDQAKFEFEHLATSMTLDNLCSLLHLFLLVQTRHCAAAEASLGSICV